MPRIRYTFRHPEGHELTEEDYFPPGNPKYLVVEKVLTLIGFSLNPNGPKVAFISAEVTNPFVHEHTWKRRSLNMFAMKAWYACERCKIQGYKRLLSQGEVGGITRVEPWQATKYERCHDQLKKLPKSLYVEEIRYAQ